MLTDLWLEKALDRVMNLQKRADLMRIAIRIHEAVHNTL